MKGFIRHFLALTAKAFSIIFLFFHCAVWSQKSADWKKHFEAAVKLITYRKNIVAETYNFALTTKSKETNMKVINPRNGQLIHKYKFPMISPNAILATFHQKIWIANEKNVMVYDIVSGKKVEDVPIPEGLTISQMTIGYDDAVFFIDTVRNKLYVFQRGVFTQLGEDAQFNKASCMIIIGGNIYFGTDNRILVFNIAKKTISTYADILETVLALDTDHLMQILALTRNNIIRFDALNRKQNLLDLNTDFISFSMHPASTKLLLLDKKGVVFGYDYLALTNDSSSYANKKIRVMKPFETQDLLLVGSEYIIHTNNANPDLREIVLEGFYPEKDKVENGEMSDMTPNAKTMACAEKSYAAFLKWSKNVPASFKRTVKNGTAPTFWLMVNDYSGIKEKLQDEQRAASVWYWKRDPQVIGRFPGFWKWEAVLTQDGKCQLPNEKATNQAFESFLQTKTIK